MRGDLESLKDDALWTSNDLGAGLAKARESGKPLFVVLRCIPCHACATFDGEVVRRAGEIADLMEDFVCVRLIQANALDLGLFQFDYDLSFAGHSRFPRRQRRPPRRRRDPDHGRPAHRLHRRHPMGPPPGPRPPKDPIPAGIAARAGPENAPSPTFRAQDAFGMFHLWQEDWMGGD